MESSDVEIITPEICDDISKNKNVKGSKSNKTHYQKYYKQAYRTSWESQPDFKGWLRGVEGQPSRAYCSYCQVTLFAHRLSLLKHTCTRKHQKAAHRIFLRCSEKNGLDNAEEELIDLEADENTEEKTDEGQKRTDNDVGTVEQPEPMEQVNQPNPMNLRLKPKFQPASGMTVTIIREDGTSDPLHLEVTDYTDTQEEIESTGPITVVQSPQPEAVLENSRQVEETTMAQSRPSPLTTHVLDTSKGAPVHGIKVSLYRLIDGRWTLVNESITSPDGRCDELIEKSNFVSGRYKLHFDVDRYFELQRQETMYPFVEIVFDVHAPQVHYHIPLLISPYGYTTYRGS